MSRFRLFKEAYFELFPVFFSSTAVIGIFSNLNTSESNKYTSTMETFSKTIGYTTVVIITGITYPVSYPLLGAYYLYEKNYNFGKSL